MEVILPNRTFSIPNSRTAPPRPQARRRSHHRHRFTAEIEEIRVCTNRTCRRQGSLQTLETLNGLAPANVSVKSCGCLGRCGAGPNLVALPDGVVISHCGTAARAAEVMGALCGGVWNSDDAKRSLEALALRKKAEKEMENGNFSKAELLLSQAIELKPMGGIHIIYKNRSIARLALRRYSDALEDAKEALTLSTHYWEAYICQGDAFLAMDQLDLAEKSYLTALEVDPSVQRSKSFKARVAKLQDKLTAANIP